MSVVDVFHFTNKALEARLRNSIRLLLSDRSFAFPGFPLIVKLKHIRISRLADSCSAILTALRVLSTASRRWNPSGIFAIADPKFRNKLTAAY
jgi:hypothetical protein